MSLEFGFEGIEFGFMQILNDIDMSQGGEVGGKPDFGPAQCVDGGRVELFHCAYHQVFGENEGVGAGHNGIALLQDDMRRDVFHHAVAVVVGLPFQAGNFLVVLEADTHDGLAVQQAHDRSIMAAYVGHHAHDAVCRHDAHLALDTVEGTFINNDIVVGLVSAVVDDLGRDVFI